MEPVMRINRFVSFVPALAGAAVCMMMFQPVWGAGTQEPDSLMARARLLFYDSVEHRESIEKAVTLFEQIGRDETKKGVTLTYIGALEALKGKYGFFPMAKFSHVKEGLKIMDRGILESPLNIESRFIRGMTCHYLPFFFNRKDTAAEDFFMVIQRLPLDYKDYDRSLVKNITGFLLENIDMTDDERDTVTRINQEVSADEG